MRDCDDGKENYDADEAAERLKWQEKLLEDEMRILLETISDEELSDIHFDSPF